MLLKVDRQPNAVGKQSSIPWFILEENGQLNWWWWWWSLLEKSEFARANLQGCKIRKKMMNSTDVSDVKMTRVDLISEIHVSVKYEAKITSRGTDWDGTAMSRNQCSKHRDSSNDCDWPFFQDTFQITGIAIFKDTVWFVFEIHLKWPTRQI